MGTPERIIYVPLGDKAHENLERAASYETWKLKEEIVAKEEAEGRVVEAGIVSLQKHPKVNRLYYLKRGIASLGGYLIKIREIKTEKVRKLKSHQKT